MVDVYKRGKAKVFTHSRYLWLKRWKVVGEIEWTKCDADLYSYYKLLKRRAHLAKEKSRIVSRTKIAEVYAKVLSSMSEIDVDLLYGLGIVDLHGNITPFGEYVLKHANIPPEDVLELVRENG